MSEFDLLSLSEKAWIIEIWSSFPEPYHYQAADCAEGLPDEISELMHQADKDENFRDQFDEWEIFISKNHLWVLIEQSCDDAVMLSKDQIFTRVKNCPREWLGPFETLLNFCPTHVLAFLAQRHYLATRMERTERFGKPDWRPNEGPFSIPEWENSSWKKASFVIRKYSG